ncbi:hypothetical protein OD91_1615 [Lutibacter sp. Hel_I_33_5]|uniref:hypothetical protein n=1 Tax=Lutibacter sp. Hel_I_33_5 TaxID=1566289 RepID=UPI0011A8B0A2|nr:hypothetical protein [Lutibacter sp. Hel_I_33_5]TVZ56330.1 hypothetical protein OD91_1615 [Lutibacter sp. Hel_I_33_5]
MRTVKLLLTLFITTSILSSCSVLLDDVVTNDISLEQVVSDYDLWYIDYHRTTGNGDVPFLSKAFTVSFLNGRMYANNNIVDVGRTGNGLGILVGDYNTSRGYLETFHDLDGGYNFDVHQLSANEIRIDDASQNVSYYLIGYQTNEFDYDKLFYENIEYFLQEFNAWEKIDATGGIANAFDEENYLAFTPENITTFYSSQDNLGITIADLKWDYVGGYQIYDVQDYEDLKILTLNYDDGDIEEFELSVITDDKIRLYHISSETTYDFSGRDFIQFLRKDVRKSGRKRTKVKRETKIRRNLK